MIRLIKKQQQQIKTDEAFVTVLCKDEVILNDSLITKFPEEPNDLEHLMPNYFCHWVENSFYLQTCFIKTTSMQHEYENGYVWIILKKNSPKMNLLNNEKGRNEMFLL